MTIYPHCFTYLVAQFWDDPQTGEGRSQSTVSNMTKCEVDEFEVRRGAKDGEGLLPGARGGHGMHPQRVQFRRLRP